MKRVVVFLLGAMVFLTLNATGLLSHLDFEELQGSYADDSTGNGLFGVLHADVAWAKGRFGGAIVTGKKGAGVRLDRIPGLDGSDACTVFVRYRREGDGYGKHQCLLSADEWGPFGGLQLQFSGDTLLARFRAGGKGPEKSWAVENVSRGRWHSIAVTFSRPEVKVYADGKFVSGGTWDHPVRDASHHIGSWMEYSFGGMIDDLRFYSRCLDAKAVAELAADERYEELEGYQDDGTGGIAQTAVFAQGGTSEVSLKNGKGEIVLDNVGYVLSVKDAGTARELVSNKWSFVMADFGRYGRLGPRSLKQEDGNRIRCEFPGGKGEIVLKCDPFDGGWKFTVEKCTLKDWQTIEICRLLPEGAGKWKGSFVNAWSDEDSAVAVRSGDIKAEHVWSSHLGVKLLCDFPAVGRSALVAVGPRKGFREQLKAMTVAAGVPRSDAGGAWAMDSEVARWSYVFAPIDKGDIDYWIEFVKRAGFSLIHFNSSWTDRLGQCPINRKAFPGGLDEMKACAAKAHAAGLKVGMHTLTACINPYDPWISPVCREDLVADASYTLAEALTEDSTELRVNEEPSARHSTVFTYSSNGNVLRIGGELVQYSGIRRDKKPYAFTGIKRGAFRTKKAALYPAGTKLDYLHQRYIAFYPAPDSKLADMLADRLAHVYNTCNLDEFYFDGSEGMGTRYGIDAMRHKIYSRLKPNNGHSPSIEASCAGANNWWFQTRTATTDHGVYGVKRFHDWHIDWAIDQGRNANFLEPQMGWWQPRLDVPRARGHMLDEMEYFASKNAGHDAPMSIQGVWMRPLEIGIRRQMTVLGWYEYPRLARAFADGVQSYLRAPRTEARLRQNDKGVWMLTKLDCLTHRSADKRQRQWTVSRKNPGRAALRVESLYASSAKDGEELLSGEDASSMSRNARNGVELSLSRVETPSYGSALRMTARNAGAVDRCGAWAEARKTFAFPGRNLGKDRLAFGAWVKGDGSGALVNFQFTTPPEYHRGYSDHHVRLDFTGWRYVEMLVRERDADKYCLYKWPYGGYAPVYRTMLDPTHLGTVSVFLNDIEKGSSATVEVASLKAFDMAASTLGSAKILVNGEEFAVPFALKSGEFAELDEMCWTHYSAKGEALGRVRAAKMPQLAAGDNRLEYRGGEKDRAELTLFALGESERAFVPKLSGQMRKTMRYEGMMPFEYNPASGLHAPKLIPVRPGEKARLSLEIYGPAKNPSFTFKSLFGLKKTVCAFNASIAEDERLVCRDGRTWRVEKCRGGASVSEGVLEKGLPVLGKSAPFAFSAELPQGKTCCVDILKTY